METLRIIYASTSGNTEHVVDTIAKYISSKKPKIVVEKSVQSLRAPKTSRKATCSSSALEHGTPAERKGS